MRKTQNPRAKCKLAERVRPKHREFIEQLRCVSCGHAAPSVCCHVRMSKDGGMGLKPDDRFTLPLCVECHHRQHQIGELRFWANLNIDPVQFALRLFEVTGNLIAGREELRRTWVQALRSSGQPKPG